MQRLPTLFLKGRKGERSYLGRWRREGISKEIIHSQQLENPTCGICSFTFASPWQRFKQQKQLLPYFLNYTAHQNFQQLNLERKAHVLCKKIIIIKLKIKNPQLKSIASKWEWCPSLFSGSGPSLHQESTISGKGVKSMLALQWTSSL